jgi:hypothetical protein
LGLGGRVAAEQAIHIHAQERLAGEDARLAEEEAAHPPRLAAAEARAAELIGVVGIEQQSIDGGGVV